jgi:beta-N-acetylglucosaminidase
MSRCSAYAFSVIAILALSAASFAVSTHSWVLTVRTPLDPRNQQQIEALAVSDQALLVNALTSRGKPRRALRPGDVDIEIIREKSRPEFTRLLRERCSAYPIPVTEALASEGYVIDVYYPRASVPNRIHITAATAAGVHNALERIPDLLAISPLNIREKLIPKPQSLEVLRKGLEVSIGDYPSFPQRGIVEGFYGPPWSHQDRLDMMQFEGRNRMNVYYYAPKDDPYHRRLWRDPYPAPRLQQLGELVSASKKNFVNFCFAISPGLSMVYSSGADFSALATKLDGVRNLGVSCFALFLDDVDQDLANPQDKAKYQTLGRAHVDLVNRLYRHLKSESHENTLMVTPTTYTDDWGSRDYIKELGAGVDPGVNIAWTGPKVVSPEITVEQAREWGRFLHRKPLVWDNYPVNDGRPWRLMLGPLVGRPGGLATVTAGLVSNPMVQPHASMIALQTIADYLWNSAAYQPTVALDNAVADQYGQDGGRLLAPFLKIFGDYWWSENVFTPLFLERRTPIDLARIQTAISKLKYGLEPLANQGRFAKLYPELAPFPGKLSDRMAKLQDDPAFTRLADGTVLWNQDFDALAAQQLAAPPRFDGDFDKWRGTKVYSLSTPDQVVRGKDLWKSPDDLSARVALSWDSNYLYIGVDVTDPGLYQPYFERGITQGDCFTLDLETAFRKNFLTTEFTGNEYELHFSPGNFVGVQPSIFSDEDYLPPRPHPHNYMREIRTAWMKTKRGYSGDIAIPVAWFEGGKFSPGYEIGMAFSVQKELPPTGTVANPRELHRLAMLSKADHLFRVSVRNPASFQRLLLVATEK